MTANIQRIRLNDGQAVTVTLKPHALNVFSEESSRGHPGINLWTFDLEGRPVGMYVDGVNYRRTLDNRYFQKTRYAISGEYYREVKPVSSIFISQLLRRGQSYLKKAQSHLPEPFQGYVQKARQTGMIELEEQAREFSKIYLPISILPPDQYMALVLQITEGCNYNRCTFCNFYRDRPFRIKTLDEVEQHVKDVRSFLGKGLRLRKSIFLGDANALVTPQIRLVAMLEIIRRDFPELSKIYSFIDVFTGTKKSVNDFIRLAELGVKRVYVGVESGNRRLLEFLNKAQMTDDIIELSANLKSGGINLGLIFLVGAGGKPYQDAHLRDSIRLIERVPLSRGDIVYLSEFYELNPEYGKIMAEKSIPLPTRPQIRAMSKEFKEAVKKAVPKSVAVSIYDIQQFFY